MARVTRMTKRRLGELLRAEGLVTEEQVKLALTEQRKSNLFLGEALVKLGFVTEDAIAVTIAQQFGLPYLVLDQYEIDQQVLQLFPPAMMREYQFLPLDKMGRILLIVGAGLMNHDVLDELERLSGCKVCQYVGTWTQIHEAHARLLRQTEESADLSGLGGMLLQPGAQEDDAGADEAAEDLGELAAAVDSVTGGSSSVLDEILATVEGKEEQAVPKPAAAKLSGSGRLSAFSSAKLPQTAKKPAAPETKPAAKKDGRAAESGSKAAVPKGGLLGFLKK